MSREVQTQGRFDTAVQYTGRCDTGRVYWRTGIGAPPRCSTDRWFERAALVCRGSLDAFDAGNGSHTDRFARFDAAVDGRWERLDEGEKDGPVECEDDGGNHGGGADPLAVYARNGDAGRPWSADPRDEISWGQRPADRLYTVYDANYLNWYHGPRPVPRSRHYVLRDVATTLLTRIDGVNVGLMATNFDQGGSVLHPVEDIETARAALIDTVRGLTAGGSAPLAETLYEAGQYYAGRAVDYGEGHGPQVSAARSRDPDGGGARYASPMRLGCQKNFIVLLTGGVPAQDVDAEARIAALPGFSDAVGPACDGDWRRRLPGRHGGVPVRHGPRSGQPRQTKRGHLRGRLRRRRPATCGHGGAGRRRLFHHRRRSVPTGRADQRGHVDSGHADRICRDDRAGGQLQPAAQRR